MSAAGVALLLLLYLGWLLPQVTDPVLKVGIPVYVCFIYSSLLAALASRYLNYFPTANTDRMALGVALFFCCDLTVGCNLIWAASSRAQVFSS